MMMMIIERTIIIPVHFSVGKLVENRVKEDMKYLKGQLGSEETKEVRESLEKLESTLLGEEVIPIVKNGEWRIIGFV